MTKQPQQAQKVHAANETTGVQVKQGKKLVENKQQKMNQEGQELKMREMMIPKRFKRAYKKVKHGEKEKKKVVRKMHAKREAAKTS